MFKLNSRETTASSFRVLRSHSQSKSSQPSVQQFVNLKHKLDFGTQRRHNQSNSERQQNTCVTAAREKNRRSPADQKIAISLPQPSTTSNHKIHTLRTLKHHQNPLFYQLPRLENLLAVCSVSFDKFGHLEEMCGDYLDRPTLSGCSCEVTLPEYLPLAPRSETASKAPLLQLW